ncbi:MAG: MIP/aquaporin family protein [Pseudomonadota bacterium]
MTRKLIAEAVGSCLLLISIIGSGIMGDALAAGQPGAALLPHTLAIGAMLFVIITLLGPVSGAHFNPAVSLVFALRGDLPWRDFAPYVAAQVVGAVLGVALTNMMWELAPLQIAGNVRTGPGQWLGEVIATAGLVWLILGGLRTAPHLIPAMVGLYIMGAIWFTASFSFANPAVSVARIFSDTFAGIQPADVAPFIGAQIVGALLGWGVARLIWPDEENTADDPA